VASRVSGRRDTLLLGACVALSVVTLALPQGVRDPLAAAMRRSVVAPLLSLQYNAELTRRAWEARERTQAERDSVVLAAMTAPELERENERLRRLLGLGRRLRWGFVPAEALFNRSPGEEYTVVLSAGARAGVKQFSPVVAPEGLVGMVRIVDPTTSIAIVWPHTDFRVSAQSADGSAFGIVGPHLGDEPDRYLLEMRGVPLRTSLTPGTLIVSSGLGGVYPRGIPIGVVQRELRTSEVWANTYLLRPSVLPSDMSSVMILHPQRAGSGVEGVWELASPDSLAADSARRADSLARARAADSARSRPTPPTTPARVDTARARPTPPAARRDTARRTQPAVRDTAPRRTTPVVRDTAPRTQPRDTARRDTARSDTVRRDTARTDTVTPTPVRVDTAQPAPTPPPAPPPDSARPDSTAAQPR
jgi:rod shape-determining protein MreC